MSTRGTASFTLEITGISVYASAGIISMLSHYLRNSNTVAAKFVRAANECRLWTMFIGATIYTAGIILSLYER